MKKKVRDSVYAVATYPSGKTYLNKYKYDVLENSTLEGHIDVMNGGRYISGGSVGEDAVESPMSLDDQRWLDACIEAGNHVPRAIPLVKPPDSKYKVGDTVIYDGKKTIVVTVRDGGYYIEYVGGWSDPTIGDKTYFFVAEGDLTLVKATKHKFKVGDPVVFPLGDTKHETYIAALTGFGTGMDSHSDGYFIIREWDGRGYPILHIGGNRRYWWVDVDHPLIAFNSKTALPTTRIVDPLGPVVGQYVEALIDRPDGGHVTKGEFGKITSLKFSVLGPVNGAYVDFPTFSSYSIFFDDNKYRVMPIGWVPEIPRVKIPEGVYGKFGDPLNSSAKDVEWVSGVGGYIGSIDPFDSGVASGKVAQMAMEDLTKSWYELKEKREQKRLAPMPMALPLYFHEGDMDKVIGEEVFKNKLEKKATIPPLDSYTQQPLIIKQNSKIKTLKLA